MEKRLPGIGDLLPAPILASAGKPFGRGRSWLSRKALYQGLDDDWTTPLSVIKVIAAEEPRGLHFALWYGSGPERPIVSLFYGVDYGGFLRPVDVPAIEIPTRVKEVSQQAYTRLLLQETTWQRNFSELVPDLSACDPERQFRKTPIFTRYGELGSNYGNFLKSHRELWLLLNDRSPQHPLIQIFPYEEAVNEPGRWLSAAESAINEDDWLQALRWLEVACMAYLVWGDAGGEGYPVGVFLMRDYLKQHIRPRIKRSPAWIQTLVEIKWLNLCRLSGEVFAQLRKSDPQMYQETLAKGFTAQP